MLNQFSRTQLLLGQESMDLLADATVAVFGIGGVGGFVVGLFEVVVESYEVGDFERRCGRSLGFGRKNRRVAVGEGRRAREIGHQRNHTLVRFHTDCDIFERRTVGLDDFVHRGHAFAFLEARLRRELVDEIELYHALLLRGYRLSDDEHIAPRGNERDRFDRGVVVFHDVFRKRRFVVERLFPLDGLVLNFSADGKDCVERAVRDERVFRRAVASPLPSYLRNERNVLLRLLDAEIVDLRRYAPVRDERAGVFCRIGFIPHAFGRVRPVREQRKR